MSAPPPTIGTAIRAKVYERMNGTGLQAPGFALYDVVDVVMIVHRPVDDGSGVLTVCAKCCGAPESWERLAVPWPCDTVRVMAAALGLKDGDWR